METNGQTKSSAQGEEPETILARAFQRAAAHLGEPLIGDADARRRVEAVSRNGQNRAGVRLLLAALLAKAHNPLVDVRKPYTEIGSPDAFSGRRYDERYLSTFIMEHGLPCNSTTAFLTPALRNRNMTLTPDVNLVGRPPEVYQNTLQLLTDVYEQRVSAEDLLAETVRCLIVLRDEQRLRMEGLLAQLQNSGDAIPLSTEGIVSLVEQHMRLPKTGRLLTLVVAAAYMAASAYLGERAAPLQSHNAADAQTGALGDVEITLIADDAVITTYEMKDRRVTRNDIDTGHMKVAAFHRRYHHRVDNYIFITTERIEPDVQDYARSLYEQTGGVEFVILDCVAFLRHFLHVFHRLRMQFLAAYQALLLAEPDSAVRQELKEAWLAMRRAAESSIAESLLPEGE